MKTKISAYQLFATMVLLPYGSAVLFFLTPDAKQDAWLAVLLYIPVGMLLQLLYTELYQQYPNDTLVTYLPKIFGRFIGYILSVLYILYFTYLAARVVRDFSELIAIVSLPEMSLLLAAITFIIPFAYGAFTGIENISRAAQFMLPIIMGVFIVLFLLLFATPGAMNFYQLKPVLENGIIPVVKSGWLLTTFPFGETVIFAMLYSSVNEPDKVRTTSLLAITFLGVILSINTIMFIVSLGVTSASASLFPLFEAMRMIKLGFLDKLDILVIIFMVLGGFFKVSLFMYAAMLGTSQLIRAKDPKYLAIPFGIGILLLSILIAKNYPQHVMIGLKIVPIYMHLPLQIILPVVALMVHYIRKASKKRTCDF